MHCNFVLFLKGLQTHHGTDKKGQATRHGLLSECPKQSLSQYFDFETSTCCPVCCSLQLRQASVVDEKVI